MLALPYTDIYSVEDGFEKINWTLSSSLISAFLWLDAELINHKFPSSSTSLTAIGRVENGCWCRSVQNMQILMSLASVLTLAIASILSRFFCIISVFLMIVILNKLARALVNLATPAWCFH